MANKISHKRVARKTVEECVALLCALSEMVREGQQGAMGLDWADAADRLVKQLRVQA